MGQREVMNDQQFTGLANSRGASRDAVTSQPGPKSGYYVSTPFHAEQFAPGASVSDVAQHRGRIAAFASGHGGKMYQGGWHEDGTTFMDSSVHTPNRELAVALGHGNKQISIYDAGKDDYAYMANASKGRYTAKTTRQSKMSPTSTTPA